MGVVKHGHFPALHAPKPHAEDGDSIDPPGGGGDDGGMDTRLTAIETRFDTVIPTLATKADMAWLHADLHKMDASIKTWMIATIVGLFLGFGGLFFAMSNALKPAPAVAPAPAVQPAPPVIINVPAPAPAAPAKR